jgi:hypothetical protein
VTKDAVEKANLKEEVPKKYPETGREESIKEVRKLVPISILNRRWPK